MMTGKVKGSDRIRSGEMYFYFDGAYTEMRKELTLDEEIDGKILKEALAKTREVHPCLTFTVREKEGDFFYVDTGKEPTLIRGFGHPDLGSPDTDMHLCAFLYEENRLCLSMYHGLIDGVAAKRILETLLYFYYSDRDGVTYEPRNVMTDRTPDPAVILKEPFGEKIPGEEAEDRTAQVPEEEIFRFSDHEEPGQTMFYQRLSLPSDGFMEFVRANETTPAPAFASLIGNAIRTLYPDLSQTVKINIPVNLRDAIGCGETFRNATGDVPLYLSYAMMKEKSLKEQCGYLRCELKDRLRPENQRSIARSQTEFLDLTAAYRDYDSRHRFYGNIPIPPSDSVFISYIGRFNGDSYVEHVKEAALLSPARDGIVFNIYDCGGRFHVSMIKNGSLSAFTDAFLSCSRALGIRAEAEPEKAFKLAYIPLRENLGLVF